MRGSGMHQWNLFARGGGGGHFIIADAAFSRLTDVSDVLRHEAHVTTELRDKPHPGAALVNGRGSEREAHGTRGCTRCDGLVVKIRKRTPHKGEAR